MIDFRYHLVSIVAIFLALTVGIVLGATILQGPIVKTTEETVKRLEQSNADLRGQIAALEQREEGNNAFVTGETPRLVGTVLAGEKVLLVETPGAPGGLRESMEEILRQAGAEVVGRVALTDRFLAADQTTLLEQTAVSVKPPEMTFAEEATPHDKAAAVLSSAVVTTDRAQAGKDDPAGRTVLDTFQREGLIDVDGDPARRATLVLLFAPAQPYEEEDGAARTAAVVSLASWLDAGGMGTVVAGTIEAAGDGGLIAAVHDTGDVTTRVSTVDALDMPAGRVAVVYALREQAEGGAGEYGIADSADAFQPSPSPTPASSATSGG